MPFLEDDEEGHEGLAALLVDVHDQAVQHLLDALDSGVDLARPHPDAAAVYGRVRATVDDARPRGLYLDPIPVPPHARIHVAVALPVALPLRVVPQVYRHGGRGLRDDQLTHLVHNGLALVVEGLHLHPERAGLQLPGVDRQERHPAHERRAEVRAAAGGVEPHVLFDVPVDPLEALRRERRSRRAHALEGTEIEVPARLYVGVHAGGQVARAGPEVGHAGLLGEPPQGVHVRVAWVAVVEDGGRPGEQAAHQQVPHHPARRGEPEEAVAGAEVYVQTHLLEVLHQDAALAVHDGFGEPRGPGRIEHPQRVVERHLRELELRALMGAEKLGPQDGVLEGVEIRCVAEVREYDGPLEGGDLLLQLGHDLHPVVVLAAVAVAVHGEENLRLYLLEAVHDAPCAEVRRTARPDRAYGRACQEGDDSLGHVGQVGYD